MSGADGENRAREAGRRAGRFVVALPLSGVVGLVGAIVVRWILGPLAGAGGEWAVAAGAAGERAAFAAGTFATAWLIARQSS